MPDTKTLIACFSGTGNSYYAANVLAREMKDAKVALIPDLLEHPSRFGEPEQVGIVFPVYMNDPPPMVLTFINEVIGKRNNLGLQYMFIIATCGSKKPGWSLSVVEHMLMLNGVMTSYANNLRMPDSYVFKDPIPNRDYIEAMYLDADSHLALLVSDINKGELKIQHKKMFTKLHLKIALKANKPMLAQTSGKFFVTDDCNGCGICYRGCPTATISMDEGRPVFGENCEGCLGCYHRCPKHAILFKPEPKKGYTWYPNKRSGFDPQYRK